MIVLGILNAVVPQWHICDSILDIDRMSLIFRPPGKHLTEYISVIKLSHADDSMIVVEV